MERLHLLGRPITTPVFPWYRTFSRDNYILAVRWANIESANWSGNQVIQNARKHGQTFSLLCQRKNSLWRINARVVSGRIFDAKLPHERAATMINNATIVRANVYGIASLTRISTYFLSLSLSLFSFFFFLRGLAGKEKGSTIENFIRRWKRSLHKLSRMKDTARCWLCQLTTKWTCSANFFE